MLSKQSRALAAAHRKEGFLPASLIKGPGKFAEDQDVVPSSHPSTGYFFPGCEEATGLARRVVMGLLAPHHASEEPQHKGGGREGVSLGHRHPFLLLHLAPPLALQHPAVSHGLG